MNSSVIVPIHNGGRFITAAIDSILGQTVRPKQIIIVDDGANADTEQAVRRHADARIEYIKQPNARPAELCNAGLNAARGELIAFLDADDRWLPTFVERMHEFLAADPAIVCAFANFVRLQGMTEGARHDQFQFYPELRRPVLLRDAPNAFGRIPKERAFGALVACGEIPAYTQVMMFRRALIESIRFEPALESGAEIHFVLRAFMQGVVIFSDEVLAEVRHVYEDMAVHKLNALKALAPHITGDVDLATYQDRLVRAHIEAALFETNLGRVRAGLRSFRDGLRLPGSRLRKLKGSMRMAVAVPRAIGK